MSTCQSCTHWMLKNTPIEGMAPCALGKHWTFYPPQHTCEKHKPATADVIPAREQTNLKDRA